jgi:hypothetical protein
MIHRSLDLVASRRTAALMVAFALGLAACGSGQSVAGSPTRQEPVAADAPAVADDPAATDDTAVADDPAATDDPAADESAADDESTEPVVNLFPDVDVLNVADGSSLNLAQELGGGDKATLLWFWAPH